MVTATVVGKSVPRIESHEKVTGSAEYIADIAMPGLLVGKVLRSPYAHARIKKIDISKAARLPGVRAVVTAEDTPKLGWGPFIPDQFVLAFDKVRFVGEEVAAVAAIDEDTAEEAIDLIEVEYEELPAVFDPVEAMAEGAPLVHENKPGNIAFKIDIERGDVEAGFRQSKVIVENTFETTAQFHAYIEPIGSVAKWDASGKLTIWTNQWSTFQGRETIAQALGIRLGDIRVIQPHVGGSFGGKVCDDNNMMIAAVLARKAGRPVRLMHEREEEWFGSRPRVPAKIWLRMGFAENGRIMAKDIRMIEDNGAGSGKSPAVLGVSCMRSDHLYRYTNTRARGFLVYTNRLPTGSMRGFGNLKAHFATESLINDAGEALGIDPLDIRLLNAARPGDTSVHGAHFYTSGLVECIERAAELSDYRKKRANPGKNRGIGVACMVHVSGKRHFGDWDGSTAMIQASEDGKFFVLCGEGDTGSGARTVLSQIAADEIGVPLEDISMSMSDTNMTPYAHGTHASRVTYIAGNAVKAAARQIRQQLIELAADRLEADPEDIDIKDGRIFVKGAPDRSMTVREAAAQHLYRRGGSTLMATGSWDPPSEMMDENKYGNESGAYTFGIHIAEVEVDPETGKVTPLHVTAVTDCGTVINPMLAQGQVEGALQQGLGYALTEEILYDDGRPINPNFSDYKILVMPDMPKMTVDWVETYDPTGPFGAKGLGEPGLVPVAPSIANAIKHACGARVTKLPMRADRVLDTIRNPEKTATKVEINPNPEPPSPGPWETRANGH